MIYSLFGFAFKCQYDHELVGWNSGGGYLEKQKFGKPKVNDRRCWFCGRDIFDDYEYLRSQWERWPNAGNVEAT